MDGLEALATALTAAGLADGVGRDYPIGSLTTYRVGGTASVFVRPVDADELEAVVGAATACEVEILLVGLGSNLLVSDGDEIFNEVLDRLNIVVRGLLDGFDLGGLLGIEVVNERSQSLDLGLPKIAQLR